MKTHDTCLDVQDLHEKAVLKLNKKTAKDLRTSSLLID